MAVVGKRPMGDLESRMTDEEVDTYQAELDLKALVDFLDECCVVW